METDTLILVDEIGTTYEISARNQRSYFGRQMECQECNEISDFRNLPWKCLACSSDLPPVMHRRPSDWWDQGLIERSRILVIGCGAVGNEVIKNLALLGVKKFTIVDFDRVEVHNLNRSILFHNGAQNASESLFV